MVSSSRPRLLTIACSTCSAELGNNGRIKASVCYPPSAHWVADSVGATPDRGECLRDVGFGVQWNSTPTDRRVNRFWLLFPPGPLSESLSYCRDGSSHAENSTLEPPAVVEQHAIHRSRKNIAFSREPNSCISSGIHNAGSLKIPRTKRRVESGRSVMH